MVAMDSIDTHIPVCWYFGPSGLAGCHIARLLSCAAANKNITVGASIVTDIIAHIPTKAIVSRASNTPQNEIGDCLGVYVTC